MGEDGKPRDETFIPRDEMSETTFIPVDKPRVQTVDEMLAEALAGEPAGVRKLTFVEQCGAFAALYKGVRNQVVAKAFGVSIQTASKLSGCLVSAPYEERLGPPAQDGGKPQRVMYDHNARRKEERRRHYEDVWREFERIDDPKKFIDTYYTPSVHKRIMLAKAEFAAKGKIR